MPIRETEESKRAERLEYVLDHLDGATRVYPIIGDPIKYAQSPRWLTRTFESRDHNGICVPLEVPEDGLASVMGGLLASSNVDGVLVTMPHKFAAYRYCATSSQRARQFGAVSVIRRNPDRSWHGEMLDGLAFVKAQRDHGARIDGARALLIGAGGAGSAIAFALLEQGVGELVIHDTDSERAASISDQLAGAGLPVTSGAADPTNFDLVFNATPLGLEPGDPLPLDTALLRSSMFVGDVIAGHGITPLIRAAQQAGCGTANGDDMVEAVQELMADFLINA